MNTRQLLDKWTLRLGKPTPRLWTDEEIIMFANDTIDELTEELGLIEDTGATAIDQLITFDATGKTATRATGSFIANGFKVGQPVVTSSTLNPSFTISAVSALVLTTTDTIVDEAQATTSIYDSICHILIDTAGTVIYPIDERITRITRARLLSETNTMGLMRQDCLKIMDSNYSGWESADESTPTLLLLDSFGTDKVRIHPPSDTANVIELHVQRNQLVPLSTTLPNNEPELPTKWQKYIDNGVYAKAYSKDDEETLKLGLAEKYMALYEQDKQTIRKHGIMKNYDVRSNHLSLGAL